MKWLLEEGGREGGRQGGEREGGREGGRERRIGIEKGEIFNGECAGHVLVNEYTHVYVYMYCKCPNYSTTQY